MDTTSVNSAPPAAGLEPAATPLALRIARFAGFLAGLGLLALALATGADVFMRWMFNAPIRGVYEISGFVVAAVVSGAFVIGNLENRHVAMDIVGYLTGRRTGMAAIASVLMLATFAFITWAIYLRALRVQQTGQTTMVLGWPVAPFWLIVTAVLVLATLSQLVFSLEKIRALLAEKRGELLSELAYPLGALLIAGAIGWWLVSSHRGMDALTIVALGFVALYVLVSVQVPVGAAMAIIGFAGSFIILSPNAAILIVQNQAAATLANTDLGAIPLFLLMGNFAIAAGMSRDIFDAATYVFGRMRGGYAVATVIGCGGFGAVSGSSVATTATIGSVAFGEMQDRNYDKGLSTGTIAAGGTLGALIPPSVILIIYCVVTEQPIIKAFQAALIPGLLALLLYVIAVVVVVRLKPELAPESGEKPPFAPLRALACAWRPIILFGLVVGGLYAGVFTVQEAASVGTALSFVFWLFSGRANFRGLFGALTDAMSTTAMVFVIIVGAYIFGAFLNLAGITTAVLGLIDIEATPAWLIIAFLVLMYLVLGSVFDAVAALLVTVPFVIPIIVALDLDVIWWGIITLTLIEIGMITPPMGMNVFVMKGMVGDRVPMQTIFKGVVPFLMADSVRLAVLLAFPVITLWLPSVLS